MASQISIVNLALIKIGADRITSLADDVKQARVMLEIWDNVRRAELRRYNWNFAIGRQSLAALEETPAFGFANYFQLPTDCLKVIQVSEYYPIGFGAWQSGSVMSDTSEYQIEGRKIASNYGPPLYIKYIKDIEDTNTYDASFVEVLACKLAIEACEPITQSNTKLDAKWKEYKEAVRLALRADAVENPPADLQDSSWLQARES